MTSAPTVLLLPGDGIGPEVLEEGRAVLETVAPDVRTTEALLGGVAIDAEGGPLSEETLERALECGLVLLGAVGGPKWSGLDPSISPEKGLLRLRKELQLYANLRPARVLAPLADASSLRREFVEGVDMLVVRELTGGIYYGEPRGREVRDGVRAALNTMVYDEGEVERIARVAFEAAQERRGLVTNIHKANVLETCAFWNEIVTEVSHRYPDVQLEHQLVDSAAMILLRDAPRFDVILCPNLFGDILSDEAGMITGSLGMLPSASLGDERRGLFEPVHGSAPDIAGQNSANPLAMILCVAMLCRYGLGRPELAQRVECAVETVLDEGFRTPDLARGLPSEHRVGTQEMGKRVREVLG